MMQKFRVMTITAGILAGFALAQQASAAIALDRTRVVFPGGEQSITINIHNENQSLPYLAQSWIEDTNGNKITSPLVVVPPLQRVEGAAASQLQIKVTPEANALPQDRESLFYFNLREIPPRSKEPNTLQLALQTRIKLFYRPKNIQLTRAQMATPWQDQLTMTRQGNSYLVNNPTPYYISLVSAGTANKDSGRIKGFRPMMIEPKGSAPLGNNASELGATPSVAYINDYGGTRVLTFNCAGNQCKVSGDDDFKH